MPMNLVPFMFDSHEIRALVDDQGEPWVIAKGVTKALGFAKPSNAISTHCKRAKYLKSLVVDERDYLALGFGIHPETVIIPVSDIYRLVIGSTLPRSHAGKDALIEQVGDVQKILKAIIEFEIPDDLPDLFVYAIREKNSGNIKLGISRDPHRRLAQLQTGNSSPLELVAYRKAENRYADERAVHADAEAKRLRGEWFAAGAEASLVAIN